MPRIFKPPPKKKFCKFMANEFYQDLITQKSFKILQGLKRRYKFILIGGWAVFLYTRALKSKDIDLIVDYGELEKLKKEFDLAKNDRLKKYEIKQEEIDIDIYLPHYSEIGLPVEAVGDYIVSRGGFFVPKIEALLILKQFVFSRRQGTAKGEKDRLDVLSLLKTEEVNWRFYLGLIKKYGLGDFKENLGRLLKETRQAPELDLNEYQAAKLRNKIFEEMES